MNPDLKVNTAHTQPPHPEAVIEGKCAFCGRILDRCPGVDEIIDDGHIVHWPCNRGVCKRCGLHQWVRGDTVYVCCACGE